MHHFPDNVHHFYALGYFHGRSEGRRVDMPGLSPKERDGYNQGYDRGVADYCEFDTEE